ncbi:acetylxylan esterase [Lysobacter korlensis]|uniref:Acetylxylan esterase n=1 Tax=Lysobacter korlensis TaxID=553636 RepID=A0ABV6RZ94_9GAMM
MLTDSPELELRRYSGSQTEPEDFDRFWSETLAEASGRPLDVDVRPVATSMTTIDVFDVTFRGSGGTRVRAWLRVPRNATGPLPTVVQYVGYGGGRGHAAESLLLAASGFAHLQMDTRGQGAGWSRGDTPDDGPAGPAIPGVMTRGIRDPHTYYYRRLFTDAVRAVDAARALEIVDPGRIAVQGGSQGAGIALAVAGLRDDIAAVAAFVPFLCDFPRATRITDAYPYREVADYLRIHRDEVERVHRTLSYFDGLNFAPRATAPAVFTTALMDAICPPSTVFAAFNRYAGDKDITVWEYNAHEGGAIEDELLAITHFQTHLGAPER